MWRGGRTPALASLFALALARDVQAHSLSDQLDELIPAQGIQLQAGDHVAHFSSASIATFRLLVERLSAAASDFPAISTAPGFTYSYDPQRGVFQRSTVALGSVFLDRAETVGEGRFDVGVAYSFVNFDSLDGDDLDGLTLTLDHQNQPPGGFGEPTFELDTLDVVLDPFRLQSHVVSLFGTYGITQRWDVNLLVPVIVTSLEVAARARIDVRSLSPTQEPFHEFPNGGLTTEIGRFDSQKTGVGDILLRTKYRVYESSVMKVAPAFTLRIPTGEEENFQGLGDVTVTPAVILSRTFGRHEAHVNAGIETNADELDRSRARYGVGVSVQPFERFSFYTDVLGSSGLADQKLSTTVPVFDPINGAQTGTRTAELTLRTDQVDLSFGIKANPYGNVVAYAGALVPINDDGLRAFITTGGFEVGF